MINVDNKNDLIYCAVELFTEDDILCALGILQEHGYIWPGGYPLLDEEIIYKNGRTDEYLCDEEGVEHDHYALMSYLHRDGVIYIHITPDRRKRIYYNSEILYNINELSDKPFVNINDLEEFQIIDIFELARHFGIDLLERENARLILNNDISILL